MSFVVLLMIALGLAIDVFMVALTCGLKLKQIQWGPYLKIASAFGLFQGGMAALGLGLGLLGQSFLRPYARYVAMGIFLGLALKSMREFLQKKTPHLCLGCHKNSCLLVLAVATSVDALVVGIPLACYEVHPGAAISLIGGTSFLLAIGGLFLGRGLSRLLGRWPSLVAVLIFMLLAAKALQG
jgi:putative Mn2+ efflux pump MntP